LVPARARPARPRADRRFDGSLGPSALPSSELRVSENRPFPPSARRVALARQAGLSAASPILVGAIACGTAIAAVVMVAARAANALGTTIVDATNRADAHDFSTASSGVAALPSSSSIARDIIGLALPVLVAVAVVAVIAHLAQTRTLWFPRRRIDNAPGLPRAAGTRTFFELAAAGAIGGTTFGWLWLVAPRLAALVGDRSLLTSLGAAIAAFVATLAIAWVVIGVADALVRHVQLAGALRMTAQEKRDDDRMSAADPRWARQRRALAREPVAAPAIARSTVLVVGDDVAVAIAWDPTRQPVPWRTAVGRRARATQLLALARRQHLPVHRDAELAAALVEAEGAVPEAHWPRLADIVAAVRR
jgi:type III secretion protein U